MSLQRITQTTSLISFITVISSIAYIGAPDMFIRMDPAAGLISSIAAREIIMSFLPALILTLPVLVLGRFFCAHICPLGTCIDIADAVTPRRTDFTLPVNLKYALLSFLAGAAFLGISYVFFFSPLVLAARLLSTIILPAARMIADFMLDIVRPVSWLVEIAPLDYANVTVPRYAFAWFTLVTSLSIFLSSLLTRRFWCRYLCPAGALFAIFSRKPLIRRNVSAACTNCGGCITSCPMGAIGQNPFTTDFSECIVCLHCVRTCPEKAIRFTTGKTLPSMVSTRKRAFLVSGITGIFASMVTLTGLKGPYSPENQGTIASPLTIRPPGALPERDFLARCIRCGECMAACPTNTLQPSGLSSGLTGFFSPVVTPLRAPCEPECNTCGQVCPTGAIRALSIEEKIKAKIGTARIAKNRCLAWEYDRECLVCDEVCPFGAIELRRVEGNSVAVPFVNENNCSGCGACQYHCPIRGNSAIIVEPMGQLRLSSGSYTETARELGLELEVKKKTEDIPVFDDELPPGFDPL